VCTNTDARPPAEALPFFDGMQSSGRVNFWRNAPGDAMHCAFQPAAAYGNTGQEVTQCRLLSSTGTRQ